MSVIEDIPLQTGRADLTHRVFHAADGRLPALREMEARLLGYLAAHPERVLPYEELLRNVWGYRAGHDRAVIHTTVRRLRRIISDPASSPNHLFSVRGEGYRFVPLAALPPPVQLVPAPVPLQATALIGRDRALQQLHALTETAPLVTVTGPGGVGKTSLVQHLLTETHTRYPGGTRFVDLSEAETRAQLFSAVAAALDMALPKWDIASALGAALDERGAHLLVLDNFEQLVDEAADVVARWVDRATAGRFVITSRVSLRLPTEQLISLRPLSTEDAAMLFVERARMRAPTLSIEPHHEDLSALVEMLDRLPLAIELAAARSRMMSPATMRRRLSTQPDLLRSRQTDRPDRHRSLRATVAWSLNLLDPVQRDLLEQCGVFVGGFTLDALEAVASLPDDDRYVDEILEDLIEHSLVVVRSEADPVRFGMLFTIREFVVEQLNARPDRDDILRRHAGFYARFGTRDFIQSARIGPDSDRNRQRMIDDLDNYRAGARRGSPEDAAYCAFAAYARLSKQGPYAEAEQLIRDVLTMDGLHPYTRAWALGNLQSMLNNQLQSQESLRVGAQAVALAEKAGAPSLAASLTQEIGYTHKQLGDLHQALTHYQRAMTYFEANDPDNARLAQVLSDMGVIHKEMGQFDRAEQMYHRALALHRAHNTRIMEGVVLGYLGSLRAACGRPADAIDLHEQALVIHREVRNRFFEAFALTNAGIALSMLGRYTESHARFAEATQIACAANAMSALRFTEICAIQTSVYERRFATAEQMANRVLTSLETTTASDYSMYALYFRGRARLFQGRLADAERDLRRARSLARANHNDLYKSCCHHSFAQIRLAQGRPADAWPHSSAALARVSKTRAPFERILHLPVHAQVQAALGDLTAARDTLRETRDLIHNLGLPPESPAVQGLEQTFLAANA